MTRLWFKNPFITTITKHQFTTKLNRGTFKKSLYNYSLNLPLLVKRLQLTFAHPLFRIYSWGLPNVLFAVQVGLPRPVAQRQGFSLPQRLWGNGWRRWGRGLEERGRFHWWVHVTVRYGFKNFSSSFVTFHVKIRNYLIIRYGQKAQARRTKDQSLFPTLLEAGATAGKLKTTWQFNITVAGITKRNDTNLSSSKQR